MLMKAFASMAEDFLHNMSKESMDQIRKTMLKHEELFKEQVQMLHYLYHMQKSVMQDIRKAIYSQAQVLGFDSDTISDQNYKLHTFLVDGKPFRPPDVALQNLEGSLVLTHDPSNAAKRFTASSHKTAFCMNDANSKTVPRVTSIPRIEIDLERPPEDYMDDIEIQEVVNLYQDSPLGRDLSDVPNLEHLNQRMLTSAKPEPSQWIHKSCGPGKETKILEALAWNFSTGDPNPCSKAFKNQTTESISTHLPAAEHTPVYKESKLPQQGKLTFTGQSSHTAKDSPESEDQEISSRQLKGRCNLSSSQVCQSPKNDCTGARPLLDEQEKENLADGGSLPSNAMMCPQSSSIHEQHDLKKLTNLFVKETDSTLGRPTSCSIITACQKSEVGEVVQSCSDHKHLRAEFLEEEVCKDSGDCNSTFKSDSLIGLEHQEPAQASQFVSAVKSEHDETTQAANIGIKSLIPFDHCVSVSHGDHVSCPNTTILQTKCDHSEPTTPTKSHEDTRDESTQEASESIAARILLSFMPDSRSKCSVKGQNCVTHMETEPTRANIDVASHERKRSLRSRRTINYYDGGITDETLKWSRSLQGRALRRH